MAAAHASTSLETAPGAGYSTPDLLYPELVGVRGWLLFFCVIMTILTPIGYMATLRTLAPTGWNLFNSVIVLFALIVGVSVWLVSPHALTLVKAYFIGIAAWEILQIVNVLIVYPHRGLDMTMVLRIRTLIWITIWGMYFLKSKRVRATFGRNL